MHVCLTTTIAEAHGEDSLGISTDSIEHCTPYIGLSLDSTEQLEERMVDGNFRVKAATLTNNHTYSKSRRIKLSSILRRTSLPDPEA